MFRVSFYCEDKRLGDALRVLTGLAKGTPEAVPVVNVEEDGGKLKAKSNGKLVTMFIEYLHKTKVQEFKAPFVRDWLKENGFSMLSYNYVLKHVVAHGLIKRAGAGNNSGYLVQKLLPAPKRGGKANG
jgi:hypothetical protein